MLVDMFELDWKDWCEGDELLEMEVKAAMQVAIGVGFRKSEFLKDVEEFNFHVHLTKSHVKYFDDFWNPVGATTENIRRLLQEGGWALLTTANLKQDQLQEKWSNFPLPFRIGSEMDGCIIAPGNWLAVKELRHPCPEEYDRERLPLFIHPRKRQWLDAYTYRTVILKVLKGIHANRGINLTLEKLQEMFATHSARVTQQVLAAGVEAPTHVRKLIGRYSSGAFEDYDRMELERVHQVLKDLNKARITNLHTLHIDTPCYPSMRSVEPGQSYEVRTEEVIVDPLHEVTNIEMLKTQFITAEKSNSLVGRRVRKPFGDEFFEGMLIKVDEYYIIEYDDGDKEDVTLDELMDVLLPTN
jgi:hypothetical protein